ncbi:hypothetical protein Hanom_Chr16g01498631 [Helianthus anomalus]
MSAPSLAPPAPNTGGSLWRLIRRRCIEARQAKQTSSSHRYPSRRRLGRRCLHHLHLDRSAPSNFSIFIFSIPSLIKLTIL